MDPSAEARLPTAAPTAPRIRPAAPPDLPAILAITNEVIAHSTAIYSLEPTTLQERRAWFDARTLAGHPVIVAERDGQVLGFASFGDFRGAWPGYRFSVEHSVHVHHAARGQGVGSLLLWALLPLAAAAGKHVLVGAIDAENAASLRLHQRAGFEQVGHFKQVGHKFGRWLDLVFVQRIVEPPTAES